uniref:aminotransferase class IV n=1 Tax=uncultured Draconibacterium sp. TaxID=1573823 RepID=UPI003216A65A
MALLPIYKYFIFNNEIKTVSEFVPSENEGGIYEVLRVVNGVPLFLEDHLERFYKSADTAGKEIKFSPDQIGSLLKFLIEKVDVKTGNILLSCKTNLKAFFITHNYPNGIDYETGVDCGILHAERNNPNVKVFQTSVRQQANALIAESALYEVLLVDKKGRITEGSRSNVFFVKGNKIITPKAKKVLLGITRQKTLQCAAELGLSVKEKNVGLDDLADYDAVFLTGTSPKILPVKQVAGISFDSQNRIVKMLMEKYDIMIDKYIKNA